MDNDTSTLTLEGFTPYAQVPRWVLRSGKHLSVGARALYGVIMTYASNDARTAFPARETLAGDLGVSVRTVVTYIKELESFGALKVERRRNKKTGNFYANRYTLIFTDPRAAECTRRDAADCTTTTPTTPTTPTPSSLPVASSADDADSSLPLASPHGDAATLKASALAMYQDGCEDPDAFIDLYETIHPGANIDVGHLIINCWGPEGTTARIDQLIAEAVGKRDPVTYGVGKWVRTLPGITHGTLDG